jgi:hypothetical protein
MVYGVLGAAFMSFLGVTLLLLLDSRRITEGRSGWLSNLMLTAVSAPLREEGRVGAGAELACRSGFLSTSEPVKAIAAWMGPEEIDEFFDQGNDLVGADGFCTRSRPVP